MNLNVALCDDGIEVFQKVQRLFQEFSKENNVQISIDWFSSGESLLECLEDYSLILLDIAIPEMDGIAFGREAIRRKYSGKIIMLTGELERFTEAFEIQAFRFVIKPIEKEKLFKALRDFLKTRIGEKDVIVYWERKKSHLKKRKFATHTFECRDQYQSLVFSNTLSANFEYVSGSKVRCLEAIYMGPAGRTYNVSKQVWTKSWNTRKAEFNTNSFVDITDRIYYYADQSLFCDTKARISYAETYHRMIGGSK